MLERALDRGVHGVQPVEGQGLGSAEPPARQRVGPVVGEQAVGDRQQLLLREALDPRGSLRQLRRMPKIFPPRKPTAP